MRSTGFLAALSLSYISLSVCLSPLFLVTHTYVLFSRFFFFFFFHHSCVVILFCVCAFQLLCKFLHHVAGAQMLVKQPCIAVTALIAIIALYLFIRIYTFFLRLHQSFRCVNLILPKEHIYISIFFSCALVSSASFFHAQQLTNHRAVNQVGSSDVK